MALPQEEFYYTYKDYLTWDDTPRYELIDGVAYAMGAPLIAHQIIAGKIFLQLSLFLDGKTCIPLIAPVDVRLNPEEGDDTVVQPDVLVVCDRKKLTKENCAGAPDLVVEVLSPSSTKMDKRIKLVRYQTAGVREYWIVDPLNKLAEVYVLQEGVYTLPPEIYTDSLPVHVLEGCVIDLEKVFGVDG